MSRRKKFLALRHRGVKLLMTNDFLILLGAHRESLTIAPIDGPAPDQQQNRASLALPQIYRERAKGVKALLLGRRR